MNAAATRAMSAEEALTQIAEDACASGNEADAAYFAGQQARYAHGLRRLTELLPTGAHVLDIGSHYVHLAAMVARCGYRVTGLDVPQLAELEFVQERAAKYGLRNKCEPDLCAGAFLPGEDGMYDTVLFCEVIEHLACNPVRLWKRIYQLLRPGGCVYLTTPNALAFRNLWPSLRRLVLLRGSGARVKAILENPTYGHHWKEYTAPELREYFARLSPDWQVEVDFLRMAEARAGKRMRTRDRLQRMFDIFPQLREHLEAVVRLPEKTAWTAEAPGFA